MAKIKIEGECSGEIDVKRFYLPGVTISYKCPACGHHDVKNMSNDYLAYPKANEPFEYGLYCYECGHEWRVPVKLTLKLEVVDG